LVSLDKIVKGRWYGLKVYLQGKEGRKPTDEDVVQAINAIQHKRGIRVAFVEPTRQP
jgi:hypothetical protein